MRAEIERRVGARSPDPLRHHRVLHVYRLGWVSYGDGLRLQAFLVGARRAGEIPDTLLLLQHFPVITLGRGATREEVLADERRLADLEIELFETNRGGRVTYHGPGQLVVYPILNLAPSRRDAHRYLRDLEEVVLRTLRDVGLDGRRIPGLTGVWVGDKKIAAIGVHFSHWITSHGVALNVNNETSPFHKLIIPCGLSHDRYSVTSIKEELQHEVSWSLIEERFISHFGEVFDCGPIIRSPETQSVQVIVMSVPDRRILLLKRNPVHGDFWQPVTGFLEPGESPAETASRELEEETGLVGRPQSLNHEQSFLLDPWQVGGENLQRPTIHREYSFLLTVPSPPPRLRIDPGQHATAGWFTIEEATRRVRWDSARRALRRVAHLAVQ